MPIFLTVSDFKAWAKIGFSDDDAEISLHLDAAESYLADPVDGILCRPVVEAGFTETFSGFQAVDLSHPDPISDVTVTYTDGGGEAHQLGEIYTVDDGRLRLNADEVWPEAASVTVSYKSGWTVADVPAAIRQAGYFIARSFYEEGHEVDHVRLRSIVAIMIRGFRRQTV